MAVAVQEHILVDGHEIRITHPDKPLWPELGLTKLHYLQLLAQLSPYLLPYCQHRYLTTIRYPHGVHGKSFYQKNAPQPMPPFVTTAMREGVNYVVLDSLPTLLWLGNLGALEFHTSFEFIGGEPAEWVLDVDPSRHPEPRLMEAISLIGDTLEGMGIRSVPKTSGATGVQVIIPIQPGHSFAELRSLGEFIGHYLTEKRPDLFTIERLIKNRGELIYFDYLQHAEGKSLSAPYTPRARVEATVSTPLMWDEVRRGVDVRSYNLNTILERLNRYGDLIPTVEKQDLSPIIREVQSFSHRK
jgi:bifunctional non-homologous end joining protein LigD